MASGSGWNLWVWLVGVVVRRYIDFILLIPTLVAALFCGHFFKCFSFLLRYFFVIYVIIFSCNINTHTGDYGCPTEAI